MQPTSQPSYQTTLQSAVTALRHTSKRGQPTSLSYTAIETAIGATQPSDLPILRELETAALRASMKTVDELLVRKGKSPAEFLSDLSEAGKFKLSALLSAGAKLKEFQADLPDLTRGATAFLIARTANKRIHDMDPPNLSAANFTQE